MGTESICNAVYKFYITCDVLNMLEVRYLKYTMYSNSISSVESHMTTVPFMVHHIRVKWWLNVYKEKYVYTLIWTGDTMKWIGRLVKFIPVSFLKMIAGY